jgi:hypothetical protein
MIPVLGGMLGAAYFRELAFKKSAGADINLQDGKYLDDISGDLLNPILSSFVARDLASPRRNSALGESVYIKDRGYAFEQKLAENTRWILNRQLKDIAGG